MRRITVRVPTDVVLERRTPVHEQVAVVDVREPGSAGGRRWYQVAEAV